MMSEVSLHTPIAPTQFYQWQGYRCAYEVRTPPQGSGSGAPLLLIHPIGVGLSRRFWDRFANQWFESGQQNPLYIPDLLGCGESAKPHIAYHPEDWAEQLQAFVGTVIQKPVIVVVQGALLPVAIALTHRLTASNQIKELILAGPPTLSLMTQPTPDWQKRSIWNLLDSPLGQAFFRYARRREFLRSFSVRQLFAEPQDVDEEWLNVLQTGASDPESRHAVFSFLAGFWRQDYQQALHDINVPTLVVVGSQASSISKIGAGVNPNERLGDYIRGIPRAQGLQISGRNILPYEETSKFVTAIAPFVKQFSGGS